MTNRTRLTAPRDENATRAGEGHEQAPASAREILVKYLDYVLPEVAAINPTSAMLLDQAIARLLDTPHGGEDARLPTRLS